jgi:SLOG family protein/SIR2-like protein
MGEDSNAVMSPMKNFLKQFTRDLQNGDCAIFVGAGLSVGAGLPTWKSLLKDSAEELGLNIENEHDLIAVAQYEINSQGSRHRINEKILGRCSGFKPTRNHELIVRLPIDSIWTTNYDSLIEDAAKAAGKIVDIKLDDRSLARNMPKRDLTLYKVHGDAARPEEAIISKDDYERYHKTRPLMIEKLHGDLVSKTFLFLGLSFTDPNIDYVLTRVKLGLDQNSRAHFCLLKEPNSQDEDYEVEMIRFKLKTQDLKRVGIKTIKLKSYDEITEMLESLIAYSNMNKVLLSGSDETGDTHVLSVVKTLGARLIASGYDIVSGLGKGVGEHFIVGALHETYSSAIEDQKDRFTILPFSESFSEEDLKKHREELVSRAGAVVFVAGNKGPNGREEAEGVRREFEAAKRQSKLLIPIASTGHLAEILWEEIINEPEYSVHREDLERLKTVSVEENCRGVLNILNRHKERGSNFG